MALSGTNPRLVAYLLLEEAMVRLDDASDPLADKVRDMMDPVWYGLSAAERAWLDDRPPLGEAVDDSVIDVLELETSQPATLIGEAHALIAPDPRLACPPLSEAA